MGSRYSQTHLLIVEALSPTQDMPFGHGNSLPSASHTSTQRFAVVNDKQPRGVA